MNDGARSAAAYRVLARTYRPQTLDDLIGQDSLVRTLRNALDQGRLAHAFVLTGVRGVGKTTTARIIAKGLNCLGTDGTGGPTINPCGTCSNCQAIANDRHVDVIEMDAASRTGVDDIRDIIEGVQYRPAAARFKIYIIDEVHMLSRNAFNALLKTLEEPPEHVKFIFATTEIRKVPVTVLSRCQRFDLRRISVEHLTGLFDRICQLESVQAEDEALRLIARAADGSARDGLSLLDQAMALATAPISAGLVHDMLGLADRADVFSLFSDLMGGKLPDALVRVRSMHERGADPLVIAQDLLETIHLVTRFKVAPELAALEASQAEQTGCEPLSRSLGMPHLGRAWQMLLKAIEEVQRAPAPLAALEMALIRLAHLSDVPTPSETLQRAGTGQAPAPGQVPAASPVPAQAREHARSDLPDQPDARREQDASPAGPETADTPHAPENGQEHQCPENFDEIAALLERKRESVLWARLCQYARPVRAEAGVLELQACDELGSEFTSTLMKHLANWTGRSWSVTLTDRPGERTLAERAQAEADAELQAVAADPAVAAVLQQFPGASITAVRSRQTTTDPSAGREADHTIQASGSQT